MTCTACERAKADPRRNEPDPTARAHCCSGCKARALAAIGAHAIDALADEFTPAYRETLERLFGDSWKHGHVKVKQWTQRIAQAAANANTAGAPKP